MALILTSDTVEGPPGAWVAATLFIGWSFIGIGLYAWARRPDNRVGTLMAATGFAWLIAAFGLSDLPVAFTFGQLLGALYFAAAIHLLLAFPDGRLNTQAERVIVWGVYLLTTVGILPAWLFLDPRADFDCSNCPDNVLLVERSETAVQVVSAIVNVIGAVLVIAVLVVLVRRWRRAGPAQRRLLVPVYAGGVALMMLLSLTVVLQVSGFDSIVTEVAWIGAMIPFGLVPYLFLWTLIRARMIQSGAVGSLIARLNEVPASGRLRDALAEALGDPSLEVLYWIPEDERFVDGSGHARELPAPGSGRAFTQVERDGRPVAAILTDPLLLDKRDGHVDAIGAAASLALENERLDAELRCKLEELRDSRERMLRIGLEERRRLERDLHDGAQQRLVSMALELRLARAKLQDDPAAAAALLAGASDELDAALGELRELARGIHPAVLSDRGLDTAIETLAHRAPVPVEVGELPDEPLPEAVELAAYFVVAEALTNVAKYARASRATVSVERANGRVVVAVADDGVGGADPETGTGLRGLADRIAVLEGRLDVDSPPGRGTTVTARIPVR
ncbi:MAG TPA: histidine kinase [Thermoleophilaceae bacterium]|jgi:signal transduction histidine kinase|nr:histidine kinase [Thermoleophilaceae bacterium]